MKFLRLLPALALLILASCNPDPDDTNPPPTPTVDDLLTAHTWQAEEIDVVYTNLGTEHYERGMSGNTINYDSDSLKYNKDGTGTFWYLGVSYSTTWSWLNADKTALRLIINYPTPITVDQTTIHVTASEFTYVQTKTGDYVATGRRIPRNSNTSPPTVQELLIAHSWQAQEIDIEYTDLSTDHYERGTLNNTIDYDSDSVKFNANGTGIYVFNGTVYNTTWSWQNSEKTALELTINYPSPVTVDWTDIAVTATELTYTQNQAGAYVASGRRIPRDGTSSPGTIQGRLTSITWRAEEIDIVYANSSTDHYVRGGSSNTINYDSDSLRYNLNGTGTFYYQGSTYSTNWTWLNSAKTALRLNIALGTPVTLDQTNINVTLTEFTYAQEQTGVYTATARRVPNP